MKRLKAHVPKASAGQDSREIKREHSFLVYDHPKHVKGECVAKPQTRNN
jgi:hypothetical protein